MRRRIPVREVVVDFCFRRVGHPALAAGAFALLVGFISAPLAMFAQAAAQPATTQKNYKDHDEYDLFLKITQTTDPKARLQLLNTWQDKYPTSDYAPDRLQYYVDTLSRLAPSDPTQRQALITKCEEQLKTDPTNFRANYAITFWGPAVGQTNPAPDLLSAVETSAKATIDGAETTFADAKKPPAVAAGDWTKYKTQAIAVGHNALAWVDTAKKDPAGTESEYRASLTANPDQGNISAALGRLLMESKDDKKIPEGLFEYARAAEYAGPGTAIPADTRAQLMTYFTKTYAAYHGSADGASQILDQAKTMALPPAGFTIGSAQAKAQADADRLQKRIDSDPAFKIWYSIKQQLTGDQGPAFFKSSLNDAEVPGGTDTFSGTVISADASKVTVAIEDPAVADATILFTTPLAPAEAAKIKVGDTIKFSGIVESYNKDPYMVTFKDPTIPGVATTAPAKTGKKKR